MKKSGEKKKPLRKQKEFLEIKCRELKRIGLVQRDRARRAELNIELLEKVIAILLRQAGGTVTITDQEMLAEREGVIGKFNEKDKSVTYVLESLYWTLEPKDEITEQ